MEDATSEASSTPNTSSSFTFAPGSHDSANDDPHVNLSQSLPNYNLGSALFGNHGDMSSPSGTTSFGIDNSSETGYFLSADGFQHSISHGSPGGSSISSTPGEPSLASPSYNMGAMSFEDLLALYYANGNNGGNDINNSMLAMMGSVTQSQPSSGTSHVTPSQLISQQSALSISKPPPVKFGSLEEKLKSQAQQQPSTSNIKLEGESKLLSETLIMFMTKLGY